jgi:hypothetical protein
MPQDNAPANPLQNAVQQLAASLFESNYLVTAIAAGDPDLTSPAPHNLQPVIFLSPTAAACDVAAIQDHANALAPGFHPWILRGGPFEGLAAPANAIAALNIYQFNIPPVSVGTLGAIVAAGNRQFALGANHVLASNQRTPVGTRVFTPGPVDALDGGTQIAMYSGCVPLVAPSTFNQVDCAWAQLTTNLPLGAAVQPVSAAVPMMLSKRGSTSGVTTAPLWFLYMSARVDFAFGTFYFAGQSATYERPGKNPPLGEPGDSGSLAVNAANAAQGVGLVYARGYLYDANDNFEGYVILICPLTQVLAQLQNQLPGAAIHSF